MLAGMRIAQGLASWLVSGVVATAFGVMLPAGCGSDDPVTGDPDGNVDADAGANGDADHGARDAGPRDGDAGGGGGEDFTAVMSAGLDHTCGLVDGQLFCWGGAGDGRLGNAETEEVFPMPEPVLELGGDPPADGWAQVATGLEHSCGLKADGHLFCWGADSDGQLGTGDGDSSVPVAVRDPDGGAPNDDWKQVSAGHAHTCGVKDDGHLLCWGFGISGQLGAGSLASSPEPVAVLEPDGEPAASDWTQVAAGRIHTCGVKRDGRMFCWGSGSFGKLGDDHPTTPPRTTPLAVREPEAGEPAADWAQVATGTSFTCGLKQDGRLLCWGNHAVGQLGSGDAPGDYSSPRPVLEPGGGEPASDWVQVAAGDSHACAVKQSGELFCWGEAENGRLGNGDDDENSDTPVAVLEPGGEAPADDWLQVTAGLSAHTCGVKEDGAMLCWGNADSGRLGNGEDGDDIDHDTPQQVMIE